MKFTEMFKMQQNLDREIYKKHNIKNEKDIINDKLVAFAVELSEFANEVRFFKYWSNKGPSPKDVILEEYVDGLHFLLSIGIDISTRLQCANILEKDYCCDFQNYRLEEVYMQVLSGLNCLHNDLKDINLYHNYVELEYIAVMERFLTFSVALGFTQKDIETAYYKKLDKNFKRQDNNY